MDNPRSQDCTVLHADICGGAQLDEKIGVAAARERIVGMEDFMAGIVAGNGGRLVETTSEEILCEFSTTEQAVAAAIAIQQAVAHRAPVHGVRLQVRIAIHRGEAVMAGARVSAETLHTAAQLAGAAQPGQILATASAIASLGARVRAQARACRIRLSGGIGIGGEIYTIDWHGGEPGTARLPAESAAATAVRELVVTAAGGEYRVSAARPRLSLGRDRSCDVIVDSESVSRLHAHIDWVRGRFMLVDQSTNGTWVRGAGRGDVLLRRETCPLKGSGLISLGRPVDERDTSILPFRVR